jgi:hypothetical protein
MKHDTTSDTTTSDTTKPRNLKTRLAEFPMGDIVVAVTIKADREPTATDLRRGACACRELAAELDSRLAALEAM